MTNENVAPSHSSAAPHFCGRSFTMSMSSLREFPCVMFCTPEYSFRKLSAIVMHFSRTPFSGDATDGRWAKLKLNPRLDTPCEAHHLKEERPCFAKLLSLSLPPLRSAPWRWLRPPL